MAKHEIDIVGDITPFNYYDGDGTYSVQNLKNSLSNLSVNANDELIVGINTYGGDTEAGFAIYNILQRFKNENNITLTTRVDGYCASIGVVILLAGDKRIGNKFSTPFIHNAWTMAIGDSHEMKRISEDLEKTNNKIATLYAERTNIDFETAKALMNNDDFVDEAKVLEYGFYTELENETQSLNKIFNSFRNINNLNNNNMNKKVEAIYNKLFGNVKNKIVYTAENAELDFVDLADSDVIEVGAKATIGGAPAHGEYVMADGNTFVFEAGVLTEIKEMEADDEMQALKDENESLIAEIETLKASQNSLNSEIAKYKEFKNQVLNLKTEEPAKETTPAKETKKEIRNFNFK